MVPDFKLSFLYKQNNLKYRKVLHFIDFCYRNFLSVKKLWIFENLFLAWVEKNSKTLA